MAKTLDEGKIQWLIPVTGINCGMLDGVDIMVTGGGGKRDIALYAEVKGPNEVGKFWWGSSDGLGSLKLVYIAWGRGEVPIANWNK